MSVLVLLHGKGKVRESDKVPVCCLYNIDACVLVYAWSSSSSVL